MSQVEELAPPGKKIRQIRIINCKAFEWGAATSCGILIVCPGGLECGWVGLVAICERNRGLGLGRQRVDPSLLWNTLAAARAQAHAKLIAFVIIRNLDDASSFLI